MYRYSLVYVPTSMELGLLVSFSPQCGGGEEGVGREVRRGGGGVGGNLASHLLMHAFSGHWICRVLPWPNGCWIHSCIQSLRHLFNGQWRTLRGVTMMEWFLDSFIHPFIQSLMHSLSGQWRTLRVLPWRNGCWILSSIQSLMHSFNGQWLCRVLPWIHSFIHSTILSLMHSFSEQRLYRVLITMTEWLLDSFIHSLTHAFVQWTLTYVAGSYDGMVVVFVHPFIHSGKPTVFHTAFCSVCHTQTIFSHIDNF